MRQTTKQRFAEMFNELWTEWNEEWDEDELGPMVESNLGDGFFEIATEIRGFLIMDRRDVDAWIDSIRDSFDFESVMNRDKVLEFMEKRNAE